MADGAHQRGDNAGGARGRGAGRLPDNEEEARTIGVWDTVTGWFGGKKPPEPKEELSQIGIYTIASQELRQRMMRYQDLVKEYQKLIRGNPAQRLEAWRGRLEVTAMAMEVIAVPFLRSMDAQNALYGQALKSYQQLFDYAMTYGADLAELFASQSVTNKEEIMGGYEYFCQNYIKTWAFILIQWSFGGQDVAPNYSITVHAVDAKMRGPESRPASIDIEQLAKEANKE